MRISLEQALDILKDYITPGTTARKSLEACLGLVLAEDVMAQLGMLVLAGLLRMDMRFGQKTVKAHRKNIQYA